MFTSLRSPIANSGYSTSIKIDFFGWISKLYARRTQLSVEKIIDSSGNVAWYAYNPRTRRSRYAETQAELVSWLES